MLTRSIVNSRISSSLDRISVLSSSDHPSSVRKFSMASGTYPARGYSRNDAAPWRLLSFDLSSARMIGRCANAGGSQPSAP